MTYSIGPADYKFFRIVIILRISLDLHCCRYLRGSYNPIAQAMHFSLSLAAFLAAPLTLAAPATVNAKAVGRLFSLNGTVTYFAGQ